MDRIRFKQVLLNLLSNAVKYNHEGGEIKVAYSEVSSPNGNKKIRIEVTDTGLGLSEENQSQLFTAFNRLDAENTNIEGTGIGLVITRNIVEMMNGNIGVDSVKGKGSTFWIEFPDEMS